MGDGEVGIKNLTGPLKVLLLFLSILAIVVPSVLGWVNFDARIDTVESDRERDLVSNKEKFVELYATDEEHDNKIEALEKREIARTGEFNLLRGDIARTEDTLTLILSELRRLDLDNGL